MAAQVCQHRAHERAAPCGKPAQWAYVYRDGELALCGECSLYWEPRIATATNHLRSIPWCESIEGDGGKLYREARERFHRQMRGVQ